MAREDEHEKLLQQIDAALIGGIEEGDQLHIDWDHHRISIERGKFGNRPQTKTSDGSNPRVEWDPDELWPIFELIVMPDEPGAQKSRIYTRVTDELTLDEVKKYNAARKRFLELNNKLKEKLGYT